VRGVSQPCGRSGLLSARERGVLRLVAAGMSNRQIAQALSISERTVKFHVTAVFNKLGAENRAQAVAIAAERGLLN
jgi:DNA-binding NarL/FixJ family response regulator